MNEKLIELEDLPDNLGVKLEDKFRTELFDKAISIAGGVRKLSFILGCHRDSIRLWKNGAILTKIGILKKIAEITNTDIPAIESKIVAIRSKRSNGKDFVKIKFPIFISPELASLVGHITGDGNLSKKQFSYFNQSRELVDEVINCTKFVFSSDIDPEEFEKADGWEIEFPKNLALILKLCGVPLGEKVSQNFQIPSWIMNGYSEIKRNYIRALFDDESFVDSSRKTIIFGMSKNQDFLDGHKKFLNNLRFLLKNLNVKANSLHKPQRNESGSFQVQFALPNNVHNIFEFSKNIGFTNIQKVRSIAAILDKNI